LQYTPREIPSFSLCFPKLNVYPISDITKHYFLTISKKQKEVAS
jgi:hypothetical protein